MEKNGNEYEYILKEAHTQQRDVLYRRITDLELAVEQSTQQYQDTLKEFNDYRKDNAQLIEELMGQCENFRKENVILKGVTQDDNVIRAIDKEVI